MAILAILLMLLLLAACGGGSPSEPTTPPNPYTITITASGVDPNTLTVPPGTRVRFVNNDSRPHNMASNPHPEHNELNCEGINSVGLLQPGQSRETGNMNTVKTCGFHDHDNPPDQGGARWTGSIVIR